MKKLLVLVMGFVFLQAQLLAQNGPVGTAEYVTWYINSSGKLFSTYIGTSQVLPGYSGSVQPANVPASLTWKSCSGGGHTGAAITSTGNLWTMGDNSGGAAGNGSTAGTSAPAQVLTDSTGNPFTNVTSVAIWFAGIMATKSDGTLWIWGAIPTNMRGNGTVTETVLRPVQIVVPGNRKVIKIQANTIAEILCSDGTVWTWGGTTNQILGTNAADLTRPQQVKLPEPAKDIAGGNWWSYALGASGMLYGWGWYNNAFYGSYTGSAVLPVALNTYMGFTKPLAAIYTSCIASYAIDTSGTLTAWGDNVVGSLGNGNEVNQSASAVLWAVWPDPGATNQLLQPMPTVIAPGIKFSAIYTAGSDVFFYYAQDKNGNLYFAGRNKGNVAGNGVQACDAVAGLIGSARPNSWDVPWLTLVNPFGPPPVILTTSPYCLLGTNQTSTPCNGCPILVTRPKANAGSSQTIDYPASSTTLNGTASTDSNGTIISYIWSQVSGPSSAVISLASLVTPTVTGLLPGTYVFQVKATDNSWKSDSSTVTITVTKANQPPVANAGQPQTISLPADSVSLDGSASYDPDGSIVSYSWSILSGPCGADILTPHAAKSFLVVQQAGSYALQLTVTDNSGANSSAQVNVTVNPADRIIKVVITYLSGKVVTQQ